MRTRNRATSVVVALLIVVAYVLVLTHGTAAFGATPSAPGAVTVSITFDDGVADQLAGVAELDKRGLKGTFYVISARLGHAKYLSVGDLRTMQAAGHEIGGHTADHVRLTDYALPDQQREICGDRRSLIRDGLDVRDFAYPFSAEAGEVDDVVASCGYNSGRISSGLVSPNGCNGCPVANALPVAPPRYAMRAVSSIQQGETLEQLEGQVTAARAAGGGWVPLVFHHICDGCNAYGVSAELFGRFLDWLQAQPDVTVARVRDVVGGDLQAVVDPPPLTPTSASNLLQNSGMELDRDANGTPDCQQLGATGVNGATWSRIAGRPGSGLAEQVRITTYTDGDRKLVTRQDAGLCAPAAQAGKRYELRSWVSTTGDTQFVAYVRDLDGHWRYFARSPALPRTSAWHQRRWTSPPLPPGATAVSVGLSLRSTGTLRIDDLALAVAR